MRAALFVLSVAFFSSVAFAGEIYPEIKLLDRRVLHHAEFKANQPTSVTFWCDEGLVSVAKKLLPPELAAKYPERPVPEPPPPAPNPTVDPVAPQPPAPVKSAPSVRDLRKVSPDGCRIVYWKVIDGAADVELHNEADHSIRIPVRTLVCRTSRGRTYPARFLTVAATGRSLDEVGTPSTLISGHSTLGLQSDSSRTARANFFELDPNDIENITDIGWAAD